jgi:creatinine amidohydrolase
MRWEMLNGSNYAQAIEASGGVCVLGVGSLEYHGMHAPMGADYLIAHEVCVRAAEIAVAVAFPPYYISQTNESRAFPGSFALPGTMSIDVLRATCDEIARNGFKKIVIHNTHGGNGSMIDYLMLTHLDQRRDYVIYRPNPLIYGERGKQWAEIQETGGGHADEMETSVCLANWPEGCNLDACDHATENQNRFGHLPRGEVTDDWFASWPEHYAGDARKASAEKGEAFTRLMVEALAEYITAVKDDDAGPGVLREFYDQCDDINANPGGK